jgi:hypothetical protein
MRVEGLHALATISWASLRPRAGRRRAACSGLPARPTGRLPNLSPARGLTIPGSFATGLSVALPGRLASRLA